MMRKPLALVVFTILVVLGQASQVTAQEPDKAENSEKDAKTSKPAPEPPAPKEESSVTDHTIKIGGQTIAYKATASTTLIKDDKGEPSASIFTIAYTRSDASSKDMSQRPISFVYNGGPGSSSIWLHMGAFGAPRGHDRRRAHSSAAVQNGRQRGMPPRQDRPRIH